MLPLWSIWTSVYILISRLKDKITTLDFFFCSARECAISIESNGVSVPGVSNEFFNDRSLFFRIMCVSDRYCRLFTLKFVLIVHVLVISLRHVPREVEWICVMLFVTGKENILYESRSIRIVLNISVVIVRVTYIESMRMLLFFFFINLFLLFSKLS